MLWCIFDVAAKEKESTRLEKQSVQQDFWLDQANAQKVMRRLAEINKVVEKWRGLENKMKDIGEMISLAEEDALFREEYETEIDSVSSYLDELELELAFSGEYDSRNAILAIHAGAGGTESQDWAEMLQRMYLRWAERRGYKTDILDTSPGDEQMPSNSAELFTQRITEIVRLAHRRVFFPGKAGFRRLLRCIYVAGWLLRIGHRRCM